MYNANNNEHIKGDLALIAQQNARQYRAKVARERKIKKCKKVALGIIGAAFFITALGIVGSNDLEAMGVNAKETEISYETTETIDGVVFYKDVILCEDNYRRRYEEKQYAEGTEVVVEYYGNGTEDPSDDIVSDVRER